MTDDEEDELERKFAQSAGNCFAKARQKALDMGLSVVGSENNKLYETFPDGTRKFIKDLEPSIKCVPGTVIKLK